MLFNKAYFPVLLLAILIFFGGGVFLLMKAPSSPKPSLEFDSNADGEGQATLLVEVSGAVKKPAVYELPEGSRVINFLKVAGGLTERADKSWVERNINLAARVEDGAKIYFPRLGETAISGSAAAPSVLGEAEERVNINQASSAELDSLWGIGPVRAQAIITGRPYQKVEELLEKKVIPSNVFEAIRDQIAVN